MDTRDWPLTGPASLLLNIHEVGKFFGVKAPTIRDWINRGQFPVGAGSGDQMIWTGADIAAFIQLRGRFSVNTLADDAVL